MKIKANYPVRRDGSYGRAGAYVIGVDGIVDVPDADALRLLATGNFTDPKAVKDEPKESDAQTLLITNGDQTIDLMTLDKDALLALARDEMGLEVTGRNSEQTMRDAIIAFTQAG